MNSKLRQLKKWDPMDHLRTEKEILGYWEAAQAEAVANDDPGMLTMALRNIIRATGIKDLAKRAGVTRAALREALAPCGNPEFITFLNIVMALGLTLCLPAPAPRKRRKP